MARDLEPPESKEATGGEPDTPNVPSPDESARKAGATPTELPADLPTDRPETKKAGVDKPENLKEKLKSTGPIAAREKTEAVYHKVSAGETLYRIHRMYLEKYGVTVADLRRLNDLSPEDPIHPGQRLLIHK
jgi:LysM repeat protein